MVRIVYADGNRREREAFRQAALGRADVMIVGVARDGQEAVQMAVQYRPEVAILTEGLTVIDSYEAANLISGAAPGCRPIMLVDVDGAEVLRHAMRMGVRVCLPRASTSHSALLDAAAKLAELELMRERPEFAPALDPARFPKIVAVTGAKGGVGKTSLAANLAVALAKAERGPTCLVDLYTQFGDIGTVLNVRPTQTLVDLNGAREIDLDAVEAVTVQHASGLHVILGSTNTHAVDALPASRIEQVFAALRQRYKFLLTDTPNLLYSGTVRVLESANLVLLVCNLMDLTTVTDTRRWLDAMRSTLQWDRLRLVLNRVSKTSSLPVAKVEESLGMKAWATVPDDSKLVSHCANKGVPFVTESPRSSASRAVTEMAELLLEDGG